MTYSLPVSHKSYIRASEVGTYLFCKRAWFLARLGAPSSLSPERARGVEFHHWHGTQIERSAQTRSKARIWALAALILFLLALAAVLL